MTRFYVTVLGKRYELATPDSMTFDEGLEVMRLSGGMDPNEVSAVRFGQMHPGAVLALTVVSIRRLDQRVTEDDIRRLKIVDVVNTLEVEEEPELVPPAGPPNGGETSSDENGSSASSQSSSAAGSPTSETIPAPTGIPPG